jgi:hypothetical protein
VLQHRADTAGADRLQRPAAEHTHRPAGRRDQPQDGVEGGRLAGAVGPQQRHRLAGRDGQGEVVDGECVAVPDGELVDVEHGRVWHAVETGRPAVPAVVRDVVDPT